MVFGLMAFGKTTFGQTAFGLKAWAPSNKALLNVPDRVWGLTIGKFIWVLIFRASNISDTLKVMSKVPIQMDHPRAPLSASQANLIK